MTTLRAVMVVTVALRDGTALEYPCGEQGLSEWWRQPCETRVASSTRIVHTVPEFYLNYSRKLIRFFFATALNEHVFY